MVICFKNRPSVVSRKEIIDDVSMLYMKVFMRCVSKRT